ncbi:MAG: S1C family serine protease [Acidimicrobiales bacterium]
MPTHGDLRSWNGWLAGVAAVAAGSMALGACSSGGPKAAPPSTPAPGSATTAAGGGGSTVGLAAGGAGGLQQAFVSVVQKVRPEVVEISTGAGLGSGIVYDARGDIVTNDHVVGSATTFQVSLADGQTLPASLVGAYPAGDLAVVRVKGAKGLSPASFADSKTLQVGDIVLAVGNPLGLASSVTEGVVSYNGRTVSESATVVLPSTIQTSASINPGNSGGALVGLDGAVVGIPTLAAVDQQLGGSAAPGIGFAIPSDTVKRIAPQLISSGHVTNTGRAELGITAGDALNRAGLPAGVIVARVVAGSGADRAGIKAGDVITAINAQKVQSLADLQDILATLSPGGSARVTLTDQAGATRTVTVKLGQLPA